MTFSRSSPTLVSTSFITFGSVHTGRSLATSLGVDQGKESIAEASAIVPVERSMIWSGSDRRLDKFEEHLLPNEEAIATAQLAYTSNLRKMEEQIHASISERFKNDAEQSENLGKNFQWSFCRFNTLANASKGRRS